jgi:hypothetical protein
MVCRLEIGRNGSPGDGTFARRITASGCAREDCERTYTFTLDFIAPSDSSAVEGMNHPDTILALWMAIGSYERFHRNANRFSLSARTSRFAGHLPSSPGLPGLSVEPKSYRILNNQLNDQAAIAAKAGGRTNERFCAFQSRPASSRGFLCREGGSAARRGLGEAGREARNRAQASG